jgi:hypothetical protein
MDVKQMGNEGYYNDEIFDFFQLTFVKINHESSDGLDM